MRRSVELTPPHTLTHTRYEHRRRVVDFPPLTAVVEHLRLRALGSRAPPPQLRSALLRSNSYACRISPAETRSRNSCQDRIQVLSGFVWYQSGVVLSEGVHSTGSTKTRRSNLVDLEVDESMLVDADSRASAGTIRVSKVSVTSTCIRTAFCGQENTEQCLFEAF